MLSSIRGIQVSGLVRCIYQFSLLMLFRILFYHFVTNCLIKLISNGNWQSGNPFLDQEIPAVPSRSPLPTICAAELQNHPQTFKLPASSPYDNFLKAAGC